MNSPIEPAEGKPEPTATEQARALLQKRHTNLTKDDVNDRSVIDDARQRIKNRATELAEITRMLRPKVTRKRKAGKAP